MYPPHSNWQPGTNSLTGKPRAISTMAYELLARGQQRYSNEIAPFNLEESTSFCVQRQARYPFLAKCM
eukprot:2718072-Rhodomonas_salina.1